MTRIIVVECDGCGKQAKSPYGFDAHFTPSSWRVMLQEGYEDLHFCSIHCVGIYLDKFFKSETPEEVKP